MTTWADLTDEQRDVVLSELRMDADPRYRGCGWKAYAAARAVLLTARETQIAAEAVATACKESGIIEGDGPDETEDVPSFVRRLRRERDEAQVDAAAAQAREAKLREALEVYIDVFGGSHSHVDDCDRTDCIEHGADRLVNAALTTTSARTALDALLAEARREGARVCVEAARRQATEIEDECRGYAPCEATNAAGDICAAVERAKESA